MALYYIKVTTVNAGVNSSEVGEYGWLSSKESAEEVLQKNGWQQSKNRWLLERSNRPRLYAQVKMHIPRKPASEIPSKK